MSDTPRTDALETSAHNLGWQQVVTDVFARTLERENTQLRAEVARLTTALAAYAEAANTCPIMGHPGYQLLGWNRKRLDAAYDAARAALAGEGGK